jgi:hypothetical protein
MSSTVLVPINQIHQSITVVDKFPALKELRHFEFVISLRHPSGGAESEIDSMSLGLIREIESRVKNL